MRRQDESRNERDGHAIVGMRAPSSQRCGVAVQSARIASHVARVENCNQQDACGVSQALFARVLPGAAGRDLKLDCERSSWTPAEPLTPGVRARRRAGLRRLACNGGRHFSLCARRTA